LWGRLIRPDADSVMFDEKVRSSLGRYLAEVENKLPASFLISKRVSADLSPSSEGELWGSHSEALESFRSLRRSISSLEQLGKVVSPNILDLKIRIAEHVMRHCCLCERRCGVDRLGGEKGACRAGVDLEISSMFNHYGEEPELVPSFTVFTMGCSFHCLHCQNYTISQWIERGTKMSSQEVAREIDIARRNGSRNLNCVGGNPDQYLYAWLNVFSRLTENVPVVWNSNAYYSEEEAELLRGVVDVYLLDFKYGNDRCAKDISNVDDYFRIVSRNHLMAFRDAELIIRILVLPGHLDCCLKPITNWISHNLEPNVRVNLMWQYRPEWKAHERKELTRRLTDREKLESMKIAKQAGLLNILT